MAERKRGLAVELRKIIPPHGHGTLFYSLDGQELDDQTLEVMEVAGRCFREAVGFKMEHYPGSNRPLFFRISDSENGSGSGFSPKEAWETFLDSRKFWKENEDAG